MDKRPYVSFAEVKERVTIPETLALLGVADGFRRQGDVLTGVCPLPGHSHGPSPNPDQFKIDRKKGVWLWHCFGDCGRGGDVVALVKAMTGYDDAHVRFWFAEHFADRLSLEKPKCNGNGRVENDEAGEAPQEEPAPASSMCISNLPEPSSTLKPLKFFLKLDTECDYLKARGVEPETIQRYGLGLCRKGVLAGYLAIPIFGYPHPAGANPVGYVGRWPGEDFDEAHPRYKFPEGFPRNQVVYGLSQAMESGNDQPLIVVEGPFKVYHLVQSGFANAVATFGASMSDEQASILAGTGRPIILLFDGNEAGQAGVRTAAGKLITQAFVRVIKLPDSSEPVSPQKDVELYLCATV